jgi:hypothetical protein
MKTIRTPVKHFIAVIGTLAALTAVVLTTATGAASARRAGPARHGPAACDPEVNASTGLMVWAEKMNVKKPGSKNRPSREAAGYWRNPSSPASAPGAGIIRSAPLTQMPYSRA